MYQLDHGKQSLSFDSRWDVLFSHTNTPKSDLIPSWSLKQRRGNILANCREGKLLPRCSPHRAESCSVRPKSRCRGKMIAFCWEMSAFLALSGRKFYRQGCNVAGNALKQGYSGRKKLQNFADTVTTDMLMIAFCKMHFQENVLRQLYSCRRINYGLSRCDFCKHFLKQS